MQYYDPNDRRSVRWALIVTALYAVMVGCAFAFVAFDLDSLPRSAELVIEFLEPEPEPEPQPEPPRPKIAEPRQHDRVDPVQNEQQVSGKQEETRTVNPKALFRQPTGGTDEPENAGNPKAKEGDEDKAHGTGGGLNADGNDQLDKGLQGRGLVGALPKPSFPGNKSGKIIVRVTVNEKGIVTKAEFQRTGSTLNDSDMIEAACQAALKARFTEGHAMQSRGTITYYFNLK